MATKGLNSAGKIILEKPNFNTFQSENTELVIGTGWVFTDPLTGNKEVLVSEISTNVVAEGDSEEEKAKKVFSDPDSPLCLDWSKDLAEIRTQVTQL